MSDCGKFISIFVSIKRLFIFTSDPFVPLIHSFNWLHATTVINLLVMDLQLGFLR
jgi:hypothetical protein